MNELALFAGAGGGILGGKLLGWRTVCAVERDPYARDVLVARQNDGCLSPFPIWDDVCTFDGKPWRGRVDVVSGGFPCQDISSAGKGAGIGGERSGLWREMARIIGEVGPRLVLVENSPLLVGRGLGLVLGDLAEMGYDATWGIVGARDASAPHKRERIWIVANAAGSQDHAERGDCECGRDSMGRNQEAAQREDGSPNNVMPCRCGGDVADTMRPRSLPASQAGIHRGEAEAGPRYEQSERCGSASSHVRHAAGAGLPHGINRPMGQPRPLAESERSDWWATEPDVGRVAHGVACRVDRLRCIGNGQVPAVVRLAWNLLSR